MAGRADLREEAVRLAELSLAPLLVAALVRELGELDVDQRLERLRARLPRQLQRPCERRLHLCTGRRAGAGWSASPTRSAISSACGAGASGASGSPKRYARNVELWWPQPTTSTPPCSRPIARSCSITRRACSNSPSSAKYHPLTWWHW